MSEITLQPIFDQSAPGIWDDLMRIRIVTVRKKYNTKMSDETIARAMTAFRDSWRRLSFNFAFGAYDGDKMIGCIAGDVQQRTGYIRHLYVLPEYQGLHIGTRLLNAAQTAVAVTANQTDLVALPGAETFYRAHGYKSPYDSNTYIRPVTAPHCETVPMFHCAPSIMRACGTMYDDENNMLSSAVISAKHMPVFAYYNAESRITGFGIIDPDGKQRVFSASRHPADWSRRCISRALNSYVANQIMQKTK